MKSVQDITGVSTYPPRQCGIATFTRNLFAPVSPYGSEHGEKALKRIRIVALSSHDGGHQDYPPEVSFEIRSSYIADYRRSAEFVNLSDTEVVSLQHEFGIFGGEAGEYILEFLSNIRKPVVTTLHTVLSRPEDKYLQVLKSVCQYSSFVVVQSEKARELLNKVYDVPEEKIRLIYHGAPDVPFLDTYLYKEKFHAENHTVLMTFGLLSPNKGIESVIEALPPVIEKFPELLYIILGKTHPEVVKRYGEKYRMSLHQKVHKLGIEDNVLFHDYYVTKEELIQFLTASDIFITPYLSEEQTVSGTLTYALACGKVIISTPYYYAKEMLADGRGCLVPFNDSESISRELMELLKYPSKRNEMRKRSYLFGRNLVQKKIFFEYLNVFHEAVINHKRSDNSASRLLLPELHKPVLPEVNLSHIYNLTDDTGILQHARFILPNRYHGYTTDDNARAAVVAHQNWNVFKNENSLTLLYKYLSFLHHAFNEENKRFRNFMGYDRKFIEDAGSEDSHSRALWALSFIIKNPPNHSILVFSTELFKFAYSPLQTFTSPRSWAYGIIAFSRYLERFGGDLAVKDTLAILVTKLRKLYEKNSSQDWPWIEDIVTYDNGRIPQALLIAGKRFQDKGLLNYGIKSLKWLLSVQTNSEANAVSLIGNDGWMKRGSKKADFDQQPMEISAMVDACAEAYNITGEEKWLRAMYFCFQWFMGNNDLNEPLYDPKTGGCHDGLSVKEVNSNQGAESTLCFFLTLHQLYKFGHLIAKKGSDRKDA